MVALKHHPAQPGEQPLRGKQERRGGIETQPVPLRAVELVQKQERRGGIETSHRPPRR